MPHPDPAVTVHRRPIYWCDLLPFGAPGLVQIGRHVYSLACLGRQPEDGYRFYKVASGATHDVDMSGNVPLCDCPAQTFRPGELCKHARCILHLTEEDVI